MESLDFSVLARKETLAGMNRLILKYEKGTESMNDDPHICRFLTGCGRENCPHVSALGTR
jgi:hypothetical protein